MTTRQRQFRAELRRLIEVTRMGRPSPPHKLLAAQRRLGQKLPPALRPVYRACDGFTGPEGTGFLRSLATLVRRNLWYREEPWLPRWAKAVIWFGDDGGGFDWGIDPARPGRIVTWDPRWERPRIAGRNLMEVWREGQRSWDSVRLRAALEEAVKADPKGLAGVAARTGIERRALSRFARGRCDLNHGAAARLGEHLGVRLFALKALGME